MKKAIAFLFCIMALAKGYSQSDGPLHIEADLTLGSKCHSVMPVGANIDLNYDITNRLSVHALMKADNFIPKEGVTDKYNKALGLGGGLGYVLCPALSCGHYEARASFTSSVGSGLYNHNAVDAGLYWVGKSEAKSFAPVVGVGFTHRNFRLGGLKSYNGLTVSLGLRF